MQTQPSFKESIKKVLDIYEELLDKYETEEEFNAALEKRFEAERVLSPALITFADGSQKLSIWCYKDKPPLYAIASSERCSATTITKIQWPTFAVTSSDTGE